MPYATNDGVCIHYQEEGSGPPLVLLHGFTLSLEHWRDSGYVTALRDDSRLILMDPRGHGASDKPHDPPVVTRRDLCLLQLRRREHGVDGAGCSLLAA
jgi:pimeloyl-ACP methyl ester carboxylesterase